MLRAIGRHLTSLSRACLHVPLLACWGVDAAHVPFLSPNGKNDANGESAWTYHAMANGRQDRPHHRQNFLGDFATIYTMDDVCQTAP